LDAEHPGRAQSGPQALQAPALERQSVQRLLRGGVWTSGALMAAGFLLQLAQGSLSLGAFAPRALFSSALPLGERLMGAGILVLAATPAARVVALLVLWANERDWRFVAVSLAVIATLAAAIALGGG